MLHQISNSICTAFSVVSGSILTTALGVNIIYPPLTTHSLIGKFNIPLNGSFRELKNHWVTHDCWNRGIYRKCTLVTKHGYGTQNRCSTGKTV